MAFLQAMILAVRSVIFMMEMIVLMRVFCELFIKKRDSAPVRFLTMVSEPLLLPIRKWLSRGDPQRKPRLDLSPLVLMIILILLNMIIKQNFI